MREIKFRAWNGYTLLEVEEIAFSRGIYFYKFGSSNYELIKDSVLLQFTGLLDKNGVEIYDGAIFYDDWDNHTGVVKFFNGIYFTESYKDVNEILEPCDNREYLISRLQRDCGSCFEVIGNIYENPHLLEAKID